MDEYKISALCPATFPAAVDFVVGVALPEEILLVQALPGQPGLLPRLTGHKSKLIKLLVCFWLIFFSSKLSFYFILFYTFLGLLKDIIIKNLKKAMTFSVAPLQMVSI